MSRYQLSSVYSFCRRSSFPFPPQAAVVTIDVTIKAVNSQARGITVVYRPTSVKRPSSLM